MNRVMTFVVLSGMALVATGCHLSSSGTTNVWSANWTDSATTPGVTSASVELVEFGVGSPNPTKFIIWSDLPSLKSHSESNAFGAMYVSEHSNQSGKSLQISASTREMTRDGGGTVHIGNQKADLKSGNVILISNRTETPEILQLSIEPTSELWKIVEQSGEDSDPHTELMIFAKSNPKILSFFKGPQADAGSK